MAVMKKLPIGVEFFRDFKSEHFYYVDKTGFIAELLRTRGSVNLFTRPRRFGKSLNMDMLKSFFEIGADASLFEGLEISREKELWERHMGKYPVISISLKDVEGENFQAAYDLLGARISEEAERFGFLLESNRLTSSQKAKFRKLLDEEFEKNSVLYGSIRLMTEVLGKHYDSKVLVLIDEYDVPLDKAHQAGYYPQMIQLIRSLFSQALKTNVNLYFAVITGCLQIAKESIFTGLNNFKVRSVSNTDYAEYFGFTDMEVKEMLRYYGAEKCFPAMKEWYDGYHFGNVDVYCPWDVISQCDMLRVSKDAAMEPHWANSSSNAIIQDILKNAAESTKAEIEMLISGECIEKEMENAEIGFPYKGAKEHYILEIEIIPELTYTDLDSSDIKKRQTYLWSVLYAAGYFTDKEKPNGRIHRLVIPNREIRGIYEDKIRSWFEGEITKKTEQWRQFCAAIKGGDAESVQTLFNEFLADSISIRDTAVKSERKENFYHGLLLGLLNVESSWVAKSNIESGIGYTDIKIIVPAEKIGCIIEVKYAENGAFDAACRKAIKQIEDCGYSVSLRQEGMETIHKYGIACYKKSCKVIYGQ